MGTPMHTFLSSYHHPKNVAFTRGGGYNNSLVPLSKYASTHGPHRQAQVDKELKKILRARGPAKSKDGSKIHVTVTSDRLFLFHHHRHPCIRFLLPPPGSVNGKWTLLWWWDTYETATDERVMKAVMAGLSAINGIEEFWVDEGETEVVTEPRSTPKDTEEVRPCV